jgi:MFS family permease
LITVRAVQGVGMAMFPLGFAMLPEVFPPARVGQAQGVLSGMFAAGAAAGLVGGGWIAQTFGWQDTYHTVIPIAIIVLILAFVYIRESKVRLARKIDFPGVLSLGVGLTLLMLGITEGAYWGWTNFSSVRLGGVPWGVPEFLILAIAAFGFFLYWEPRAPSPVVSFRSLRERNILLSNINGVIVGMAMFLLFTVLIILGEYPSPGFGLSELNAGLILVPAVLSMLVAGPILGGSMGRFGPKPVMQFGFVLIILGAFGLAAFNRSTWDVAVLAVPMMVGNVAVLISMSNIVVLSVDPKTMGIQTGMNQTFRNLGSALGPVLVTSILASYAFTVDLHTVVNGATVTIPFQDYHVFGYQLVFSLVGVIGIVGLACAVALRNFRFLEDGTRAGHQGEVPVAEGETREPPVPVPVPLPPARRKNPDHERESA